MTAQISFYGVTLDCADPARLAEFYSQLTGMKVSFSSDDYAGLSGEGPAIGFQRVDGFQAPKWPGQDVPQQFHLDFSVQNLAEAEKWVVELGATKPDHQPGGERWVVLLDPAGHPFCLTAGS
jgi:catechol 2,3-dioxygenase-like lactoylglutathione lyase family enzyme